MLDRQVVQGLNSRSLDETVAVGALVGALGLPHGRGGMGVRTDGMGVRTAPVLAPVPDDPYDDDAEDLFSRSGFRSGAGGTSPENSRVGTAFTVNIGSQQAAPIASSPDDGSLKGGDSAESSLPPGTSWLGQAWGGKWPP